MTPVQSYRTPVHSGTSSRQSLRETASSQPDCLDPPIYITSNLVLTIINNHILIHNYKGLPAFSVVHYKFIPPNVIRLSRKLPNYHDEDRSSQGSRSQGIHYHLTPKRNYLRRGREVQQQKFWPIGRPSSRCWCGRCHIQVKLSYPKRRRGSSHEDPMD